VALLLDARSPPQWFLVFTKAGAEQKAQINLERQGYEVYYPRLTLTTWYRCRWVERMVALFPRYVFVRIDPAHQSLAPVRSTVGVARIVTFGGEATVVPDAIVNALVQRADPQTGLHRLACERRFQRGAPVKLIAGVLESLEGIFECEMGNDRSIVLLDVLGTDTSVRVPSQFLVPSLTGARRGHYRASAS
jgi:transcriptional antiterminator RfaH